MYVIHNHAVFTVAIELPDLAPDGRKNIRRFMVREIKRRSIRQELFNVARTNEQCATDPDKGAVIVLEYLSTGRGTLTAQNKRLNFSDLWRNLKPADLRRPGRGQLILSCMHPFLLSQSPVTLPNPDMIRRSQDIFREK
ncbi:hypothetical protein RRG08_017477 [Elysia crispata]|uniref:Uncharacterized protein n=1 Tax=Elysia crispata TaxID=231223 RepID=A0AAE0YIZ0_9GAST|nr:hypothetical protein RRG08_017477 [Elysia crispata]